MKKGKNSLYKVRYLAIVLYLSLPFWFSSCGPVDTPISFMVLADTHFEGCDSTDRNLIDFAEQINSIGQRPFPDSLGMSPEDPRGVILVGDITQDGYAEEWTAFKDVFGLDGDALIRFPVYEGFGNHDGNIGGPVRSGIAERNIRRPGVAAVSENGLHYAWKWGRVHFVQLNLYPSKEWDPDCGWCHYFHESFREPQNSLGFLSEYLEDGYVRPGEAVVLFFHYGWDDFSGLWWTDREQQKFYEVVKDHNILGIFNGHCHAINHYTWNGIDIWSSGSPQKDAGQQESVIVRIENEEMHVLASRGDEWVEIWSKPVSLP